MLGANALLTPVLQPIRSSHSSFSRQLSVADQTRAASCLSSVPQSPHHSRQAGILSFGWHAPSWGPPLQQLLQFLVQHVLTSVSGTSTGDSSASDIKRIHSSFSKTFVISCSFFTNITCVSRKWQCSVRSPVAHRTVSVPSALDVRLLCLAPAKATLASRCSSRSPVGPGALLEFLV